MFNACEQFCMVLLRRRSSMTKIQYDLSAITFLAYGTHHRLILPHIIDCRTLLAMHGKDISLSLRNHVSVTGAALGIWRINHLNPFAIYMTQRMYEKTRWRHQMELFSASLALCAGNSPVTGEFPSQRPVTRSFDVFFDLHMNGG